MAIVGVWAQTKSVTVMTDSELKAAIDSIAELEQPLTAQPLIDEAKKRATSNRDTKWMFDLIKKEVRLNGRRLSRQSSAKELLSAYRENAWVPLRQVLSAECYALDGDERDAFDAVSHPDELRKFNASDVYGGAGDVNLLDYLASSLAILHKYDVNRISQQLQVNVFNSHCKAFAESTDTLPFPAAAARVIMREGLKNNDSESVVVAQALRVVLASCSRPLSQDSLIAELESLKADGQFASNLILFAKASAKLAGLSRAKESVAADNERIDEAVVFLNKIKDGRAKADSANAWMAEFAGDAVNDINRTELSLKSTRQVIPDKYTPISLSYRNIYRATVNVYRIASSLSNQKCDVVLEKTVADQKPVLTKSLDLPQTQSRVFLSSSYTELDGLGCGYYLLTASSSEGKILAATTFFCSSISPKLISVGAKDYMQVSDFETGAPLSDVKVSKKSTPGKDGWMQWRNSDSNVEISRKGDYFFANAYSYSTRGEWIRSSEKTAQLISDRRIYRPGQSILFKVYFYESFTDRVDPSGAGKSCTVKLYGANGKELTNVSLKLDEFGSASGQLDIPADAVKGMSRIMASCGKVSADSYVRVEDFKRTDNTVVINPFDEVILPGAEAVVSGSCVSAAGLPVSNATVAYEVRRESEIITGQTTTSDGGAFSFSFKAIEGAYDVAVRITDVKGETAEASRILSVSPAGYYVAISLKSPNSVVGDGPIVTLSSLNCNGRPYKSKVRLTVTPYEPVAKLLPALGESVDSVIGGKRSVIFGKAAFENNEVKLSPVSVHDQVYEVDGQRQVDLSSLNLPPRRYRIVASAAALDSSDLVAQADYLALADKGRMDGLSYLMLDAPASVKAGMPLVFRLGSGLDDAYVTVLISKADALVLRKQVKLSRAIEKIEFNVPEDCVNGEILKLAAFVQKDGASYTTTADVRVEKEEAQLTLALSSFRNRSVPGAKEQWTVTCLGPTGRTIAAGMYDSRLDKYVDNKWNTSFDRLPVRNRLMFGNVYPRNYNVDSNDENVNSSYRNYASVNVNTLLLCDAFERLRYASSGYYSMSSFAIYESAAPMGISARRMNKSMLMAKQADVEEAEIAVADSAELAGSASDQDEGTEVEAPSIRQNFAETVFFLPTLTPEADGKATFEFTLPDNLTTYNFQALAVDKNMRYATISQTLTVAKPINVQLGLPRFATEGDSIYIPVSVASTDSSASMATLTLTVSDQATKQVYLKAEGINVGLNGVQSVSVGRSMVIPDGVDTLSIEAVCKTSNGFSDGELRLLPVASRNIELEESRSFVLTGKGSHKVINPFTDSKTKTLTFNYSSNAFIEVLRVLPTLDNSFTPCTDTYLGRYESAAIASLLQSRPDIQKAVKYLKDNEGKLSTVGDADNGVWYLVAKRLAKHDKDVVKLLSGSYASRVRSENLRKLSSIQLSDGSFPWFSGMNGSEFITVAVVSTLGEMQMLGLIPSDEMPTVSKIISKAKPYIDSKLVDALKDYDKKVGKDKNADLSLPTITLSALQARILMGDYSSDKTVTRLLDILKRKWQYPVMCDRVTAMFVLAHVGESTAAATILKSIEENLVETKDGTAYIPENGLFHRREQVEAQAMLIIALKRLNPQSPNTQKIINHLVLMKRGEAWPDAQSTSRAVLALLASATSAEETDVVEVGDFTSTCTVDNPEISVALAADGIVKRADVKKSGATASWGSWSRIMRSPIDELNEDGDDKLKVSRTVEVRRVENGEESWMPVSPDATLKVGDQLRVTLKFYNDEPLSFVRIRDFRSAAVEPDDKLSGYKGWWFWRLSDANIPTPCHYLSISDEKTEFFIDYLYEGWHRVSYTATVTHSGDFTGGYAEAQCMYATEIMAHTSGLRIKTER